MKETPKFQLIVAKSVCNNATNETIDVVIEEYVYSMLTLTLCPFNIAGNAFALYIFSLKVWKKSCMSYLLKALSLTEVLFQAMLMVYIIVTHYQVDTYLIRQNILSIVTSDVLVRCIQILLFTFQLARNWSVVSLAIYRFEAVCLHNSSTKVIVRERVTLIYVGILATCFIISLPRTFEIINYYCEANSELEASGPFLLAYAPYRYGYVGCAMFLFQSGGPIVLVCVFSGLVVRKIQIVKQFRRARNMTERGSSSDKLVIAVCFTFFLLEMPSFFSKIFSATDALQSTEALIHFDSIFAVFANLCINFDSTLNIVIYMTSNRMFREATLQKFGITVTTSAEPVNV